MLHSALVLYQESELQVTPPGHETGTWRAGEQPGQAEVFWAWEYRGNTYADELWGRQHGHGTEAQLSLGQQLLRQGLLVQQEALLLSHRWCSGQRGRGRRRSLLQSTQNHTATTEL